MQPLKDRGFVYEWRSEVNHGHDFKVPTAQLAAHYFGQLMEQPRPKPDFKPHDPGTIDTDDVESGDYEEYEANDAIRQKEWEEE
jgi:hypothetical protein